MKEKFEKINLSYYDIDINSFSVKEQLKLRYEISNFGGLRRKIDINKYKKINGVRRSNNVYLRINTSGINKRIKVEHLVIDHFTSYNKSLYTFKHIDGNKYNCNITNLSPIPIKCRQIPTIEKLRLLNEAYESEKLHRAILWKYGRLNIELPRYWDTDDLIQEFYAFVRKNLYQWDEEEYNDFTQFIFYKAHDFLIKIYRTIRRHNFNCYSLGDFLDRNYDGSIEDLPCSMNRINGFLIFDKNIANN